MNERGSTMIAATWPNPSLKDDIPSLRMWNPEELIGFLEMKSFLDTNFLFFYGSLFWWESKFDHSHNRNLNDSETSQLVLILTNLETVCKRLGLNISLDRLNSVNARISGKGSHGHCDTKRVVADLRAVWEVISSELKNHESVHVPDGIRKYFDQEALFGSEVYTKFPSTSAREDIRESGTAFAVGLYSATVFHLMRVMERGVRSFGRKLKVPEKIIELKEWHPILVVAKKKIDKLPQKTKSTKQKKAAFSAAWNFLDQVRIAWRNPTMHPKEDSYTEEEAKEIIDAVKTFMIRLAKII
jgi:hypothetical protein